MIKICVVSSVLALASALSFGADEPDVFAGAEVTVFAKRVNGINAQVTGCFTGDENFNPKTVFFAGDTVCWYADGIVTPKGTGPVSQNLSVDVTTPRRSLNFFGTLEICNTSVQGSCNDEPDFTTWTVGLCVGPIPPFVDRLLQRVGPVPFSSVVTGSGYESFVHPIGGTSVSPLP